MPAEELDPVLGDYLDAWLERRRTQVRPATIEMHRQLVRCYLQPQLGRTRLAELDRRILERHYGQLLVAGGRDGRPLSPRTVEMAHNVLHKALEDARLDGLIPTNPAAQASPPKRDPFADEVDDGPQIWTVEQVAHFLDTVEDHPRRDLWHLAVGTGARRAELLGLRWRDVDLEGATVTFQRSLTVIDRTPRLGAIKNSRPRTLAVGPTVVAALRRRQCEQAAHERDAGERWRNRWQLVFTHPDGRNLHPHTTTAEFRQLVRGSALPAIRLQDLRHTHASLLLAQKTPMKVISDRLGHSSITVTMDTYAHLLPTADQEAVATFDAAIRDPGR